MEAQIVTLTIEHAQDVQRLSKQLGYPLSLTEITDNIREVEKAKDQIVLAAMYDKEVIGWIHGFRCTFLESKPFLEIGGLIVDENYRSKGIGRTLLESIKEWATKKDIHEIRVRSNVKRTRAHRFYLSNGFEEIKEQKVFQMKL